MNIINIYKPNHYSFYIDNVKKDVDYKDIDLWIKKLNNISLNIYLKVTGCLNKNCNIYIEERFYILTMIVYFFILELNIDQEVNLSTKQIHILSDRFKDILTIEYAYRKRIIKKRPTYTLLRDIKINQLDLD
jgi:hypothetical protein